MLKGVLNKVVGDPHEREIKRVQPIVDRINELEPEIQRLTDPQLRDKTQEFLGRLHAGETLDDILPEAFAVVREASVRTTDMRHFDVQLSGGIVLHQGRVAEMKTGEGKTLVATLPLYLNALEGQGAHLITVNDYLAKRDTQWMGPIYHLLGLSVSVIQSLAADPQMASFLYDPDHQASDDRYLSLRPVSRTEAYAADITYGTNNEFGFDYLRDNLATDLGNLVQRGYHYAIVDEVDNILIDESRTPLIISGPAEESLDHYQTFARLVPRLKSGDDYGVEEKGRVVTLTDDGVGKIESWLGIDNVYSPEHYQLTPYLEQALKAEVLFRRDRDYIVKDGQVIIVDEFTGRLMHGRRYSEGLHQAIEAKEGVRIQRESLTLATITFQNFFRMYTKLAGMTGTAATEAEEFDKIYGLEVVVIPTHERMIRDDHTDLIYKTERAKYQAAVDEIAELHEAGRPVLVGTVSIEKSELLSEMLKRRGIPHQVLNAKQHEKEAGIIVQAGRPGAVTIATNMAGRGVDIKLGGDPEGLAREALRRDGIDLVDVDEETWSKALARSRAGSKEDETRVLEAGGLHVLGTERHEARRIDNQLRGRSGRQGDPGSSRFYVSLEDDLMRRFGGQTVAGLMDRLGLEEDVPIEHDLVTKSIESAQVRVEGYNFDLRKHLLEYDDVINKQREVIYEQRRQVLEQEDLSESVWRMVTDELPGTVALFTLGEPEEWDLEGLGNATRALLPLPDDFSATRWQGMAGAEIEDDVLELAEEIYRDKESRLGEEIARRLEKAVMLQMVDGLWVRHLTALDELRTGVGLRAYGQRDPLVEFKREAHAMFDQLTGNIQSEVVRGVFHAEVVSQPARRAMQAVHPRARVVTGASAPAGTPVTVGDKLGRNDPCWCGSGKKYKHCHLRKDRAAAAQAVSPTRDGEGAGSRG
ncbi:MAG: preprotein translocase subunit SecA [Anaerolineae bacterium]